MADDVPHYYPTHNRREHYFLTLLQLISNLNLQLKLQLPQLVNTAEVEMSKIPKLSVRF